MSKKMNVVHLKTLAELLEIANERGSVRVGSTINPNSRASSYASDGYRGTMYVVSTNNMRRSEDRLLAAGTRHNVQSYSNAAEDEGFVYVIVGQRREQN